MRHNPYYSFIIILFFIQPLSAFILAIKRLPSHIAKSQDTFTQLLSKVFLNKYNKTFSCDLTWSIMTKCIMKKNWTCSAGALELILASCFIRQFMRLIVHFYSELTSNHHRVFVITSFCDHMGSFVKICFLWLFISLQKWAFQMYTFISRKSHTNHILS